MAIDFPSSPTNGQVYQNYYYDSSLPGWRNVGSKNGLSQRVTALEATSTTYPSGLIPVIPSSVVVGSGSASVSSIGVVTFSGITSAAYISLNGVFTSAFTDYKILITQTLASGTGDLFGRWRYNGTDYSGGVYGAGSGTAYNNAGVFTYGLFTNTTNFALGPIGTLSSVVEITASPRNAFSVVKWHAYAPHSAQNTIGGYNQSTGNRPDGITFLPGASSISGTVQVFGYRS